MAETLAFNETELAALIDLADGRIADAAAAETAFASLVQRGLASIEGDDVVFSEAMASTFEALSTCKTSLLVMNDAGEPVDQYYLGDNASAARVSLAGESLGFGRMKEDELPAAIAESLAAYLAAAKPSLPPNAATFEALGAALDMEGLQPLTWGGLAITRGAGQARPADAVPDWVLVVRTEPGFVWEYGGRGILSFAHNEDELAELVADALSDL